MSSPQGPLVEFIGRWGLLPPSPVDCTWWSKHCRNYQSRGVPGGQRSPFAAEKAVRPLSLVAHQLVARRPSSKFAMEEDALVSVLVGVIQVRAYQAWQRHQRKQEERKSREERGILLPLKGYDTDDSEDDWADEGESGAEVGKMERNTPQHTMFHGTSATK